MAAFSFASLILYAENALLAVTLAFYGHMQNMNNRHVDRKRSAKACNSRARFET